MNNIILPKILELVDLSAPYRYVQTADITTLGSSTKLVFKTDAHRGIYVRRHHISAFYKDASTSKAVAIIETATARDIITLAIQSGQSALGTENPMDMFAFNRECDDHDYPGYVIAAGTTLTFEVFHTALTTANAAVPIRAIIALSGWQLKDKI